MTIIIKSMAIIFKNETKTFNNGNDLVIFFKQKKYRKNNFKEERDFYFIFADDGVVGINIFNYTNYFFFDRTSFHSVSSEIRNYLLNYYNNYLKESYFASFFQIGKVIDILDHYQSTRLKIFKVKFFDKTLQIITNVQNIVINNKYLFALDGAVVVSGLITKESKVFSELLQRVDCFLQIKSIGIDK